MSANQEWDLQETRQLIGDMFGKEQLLLARQSLNSTLDRLRFAGFHFHEAMERWDQHHNDIKNFDPIHVVLGQGDEEVRHQRAERMDELSAHVQACVQSLHAIPDILAHGIYYSLALNIKYSLSERKIAAWSISQKLALDPSLRRLDDLFRSIYSAGDFEYLDALNNHGKHRSIINTAVWSDLTGLAENPISLQFSDFKYSGANYSRRDIRPVLTDEYARISKGIVQCGVELLNILKLKKRENETGLKILDVTKDD